jgi:hypothetical protein
LALDERAWYHALSFSFFVARLAPGVSPDRAHRDYAALIPRIRQARGYPDDYGRTAHLEDLRVATVGDVRSSLVALGAAAGLILLIAGMNVGILALTRASARRRDVAVRAALGASAGRLAASRWSRASSTRSAGADGS